MKSYILNIMALVVSIPVFVSCLVDDADVNYIDAADLTLYAKEKLANTVALPLEALELSVYLDEYINLPEEEKGVPEAENYYCKELAPGLYEIRYESVGEFRVLQCKVETYGKSIHEEGASWKFHEFRISGNDFDYSTYDFNWSLPDGSEISMLSASDSTWTMEVDDMAVKMKMHPKVDGLFVWSVTAQGSEETRIGVKADYGTKGELAVREIVMPSAERTNQYEGLFYVDIFRDGDPVDYCHASFAFGARSRYNTSR